MLRKIIKKIIIFILHPMLTLKLRGVMFNTHISINSLKHFCFGKNIVLGQDARLVFIEKYCDGIYNPKLTIGDGVNITDHFTALVAAVTIESNCLIGSYVFITSENHGINPELSDSYDNIPLTASPVYIGKGCWIGEKACIMPGVTLGERCIVAAGAVVTKSFPSHTMIAGVPAKAIKKYNFETHNWEKVG